jgi:cystathionine gamma-lyase
LGKESNVLTAVDNTFMTPFFQRPIELGIDIVMHSMTKYLNGHSDVVMGALMFKDRTLPFPAAEPGHETLYARLKFLQNAVGSTPGPFDSFLVLRGLKTLAVRMERHGQNALKLAGWLANHPKVERVLYPGLPSHPGFELARRQTSGAGGMLTFFIKGGLEAARTFLSEVKLFTLAESLGGVESLIEHPAIMTHASVPPEVRKEIGLTDNLIRISVGIENVEDLMADMDRAFSKV